MIALHLVGCTVSPCNPLVKANELTDQLKLSKASKIIATTSSIDIAKEGLKGAGIEEVNKHIAIFSGNVDSVPTLESFISESTDHIFDPEEWDVPDAPAFICWSSGTSGPPKALALTHRNIVANILQFHALLGDRFNSNQEGCTDEVHIDVLPQFHAYGLITTLLAFHTCTPRYVMERFDVTLFAQIAERTHATFSMLVPPARKLSTRGFTLEETLIQICSAALSKKPLHHTQITGYYPFHCLGSCCLAARYQGSTEREVQYHCNRW